MYQFLIKDFEQQNQWIQNGNKKVEENIAGLDFKIQQARLNQRNVKDGIIKQ